MSKKKKRFEVYVYEDETEDDITEQLAPGDQRLRCQMEKKNRGGKMVTVINGFVGLGIEELAKKLKTTCGIGGSAKDGEIILQGDVRKKVIENLIKWGYRDTK